MQKFSFAAVVLMLIMVACVPRRDGVSWPDLSVDENNNILIAYKDSIDLVDPANGRPVQLRDSEGQIRTDENGNPRRWIVDGSEGGSQFFASPIPYADDTWLFADYNNRLVTVDVQRATIEVGRQFELPGHVIADMVVSDNILVVPLSEHDLVAYDFETFEEIWRFETDRGIWSAPIVIEDIIYVGSMDHNLYAINLTNGSEVWRADVGGAIGASPLHIDDSLFVGTFDRKLVEVSLAGEILNEYETDNWVWNTPVLFDGLIYFTDMAGSVYALDPENALSEVWKQRAAEDGIRGQPLVTEEYVIVAARNGRVYWLDRATGSVFEDFTQNIDAEVLSDVILVEQEGDLETLVVVSSVSDDKILSAFTLDAVPRWTYSR